MDFYVYDNVYTYNKRHPFSGSRNDRLEISEIDIPENHAFWFYTQMNVVEDNVNVNKRYVHIHPGVGTTNKTRFNKEPFHVTRKDIFYNKEEKRIEIKKSLLPWSKPIFAKKCLYYGSDLPHKKMTLMGEWYYDFSTNSIHMIIDYNTEMVKFHWEDDVDEPSRVEQLNKIADLEQQVKEAEEKLG
jgi:hypothetical protein